MSEQWRKEFNPIIGLFEQDADRIAKVPALESAAPTAAVRDAVETLCKAVNDEDWPLLKPYVQQVRTWLAQYQEGV